MFIIFMGILGTQNMLMCTLFWGGSQKVYGLYTHENVDIYGRSLVFFCILVNDYTLCLIGSHFVSNNVNLIGS